MCVHRASVVVRASSPILCGAGCSCQVLMPLSVNCCDQHERQISTGINKWISPVRTSTKKIGNMLRQLSAGKLDEVLTSENRSRDLFSTDCKTWLKEHAGTWEFDAFELEKLSGNRPLQAIMWWACEELDLIVKLGLDRSRFRKFLAKVEKGYHDNPYHARW